MASAFATSLLSGLAGLSGATDAAAAPLALSDEDLVILRLRTNRFLLSDGLIGYQVNGSACVSFFDVAEGLEFAIEEEATGAAGWFFSEDKSFRLDVQAGIVEVGDDKRPLNTGEVYDDGGVPCVAVSALEEWFSIDLDLDLANAEIVVSSQTPLPVEARRAREKRRAEVQKTPQAIAAGPIHKEPYRAIGWPAVNASLTANVANNKLAVSGDLTIAADTAFMSTDLFVAVDNQNGLQAVRGTLGRRSGDGSVGLGLPVTELAVGDVSSVRNRLSANGVSGRGVYISNRDIASREIYDTTRLRGDLPPGWDVELYRNEALVDFASASNEGVYEFDETPVLYGRNEFRLAFYGPQGQRRDEYRDVFVGESVLPKSDLQYSLAVNQQGQSTIFDRASSLSQDTGQLRVQSTMDYGVAKNLTVGVDVASYSLRGERKSFVDVSAISSLAGFGVYADASFDVSGGAAFALSTQGDAFGVTTYVAHQEFLDYESERARPAGDLAILRRTSMRADFLFKPMKSVTAPISFEVDREEYEARREILSSKFRVSTTISKLSITNELFAQRQTSADGVRTVATGKTLMSVFHGATSFRGELNYQVAPQSRVTSVSLTADTKFNEKLGARIDASYNMDAKAASVGVAVNYRLDELALSAYGRRPADGGVEAGVALTASFARNPTTQAWTVQAQNAAKAGMAVTRIFVDNDQDGRWTEGDEMLPEAAVLVDDRPSRRFRPNGGALLTGLPVHQAVSISIDMTSIQDPYLLPPIDAAQRFYFRPGVVTPIDIPLNRSGEVVGEVLLRREEELRGVGEVQLQLVDSDGVVKAKTLSEYDGFFVFERLKFGAYDLRVAPDQLQRLGLQMTEEIKVNVSLENDLVEGVQVELKTLEQYE